MPTEPAQADCYALDDGLGRRHAESRTGEGIIEALDLAPALAGHPAVESAVRGRMASHSGIDASLLAAVRRVERLDGGTLRVVSEVPEGIRLSDLLADLEFGNETLSDAGLFEIASAALASLAAIHRAPGALTHGAINPAHLLLTPGRTVVLTDGVFGSALEVLQLNREQLWREFGLALPAAANLPRFDQRSDVTQLGACVLALALRRPIRFDEYPRGIGDLVTVAARADTPHGSALNMWLQQALHLHPRAVFGSASAAQREFADIVSVRGGRRAGAQELRALLGKRLGGQLPEPAPAAALRLAERPPAMPEPARTTPLRRSPTTFLRAVFSNLGAS